MKHIDEHTLELFVLGAKEVQPRKKAIESHLKKCEGCRVLAQDIETFYAHADAHFASRGQAQPLKATLVRTHSPLDLTTDPYPLVKRVSDVAPTPKTLVQHVFSYAKQNPIKFSAGSFVFLGVLAFFVQFTFKTMTKDTNPSYSLLNVAHTALEVYNHHDDMLWHLPLPTIDDFARAEQREGIHFTYVADLNGDGENEVITILPSPSGEYNRRTIRVFDENKDVLLEKRFEDRTVNYLSNHYEADFVLHQLIVDRFGEEGRNQILVSASNSRSPWFLARLDAQLKPIGKYWHFGQMMSAHEVDLFGNGKKQILLCGVNQANELTTGQFSVIAVVDPTQIVGTTEATTTRGFGFGPSAAELYYIRIPESNMALAMGFKQGPPNLISAESEPQLRFSVNSSSNEQEPGFEYVFAKDMRIQTIKYNSQDVLLHAKLKSEGKISTTFDEKYLDDLKSEVRYWDGKEWRKEATRVRSDLSSPP